MDARGWNVLPPVFGRHPMSKQRTLLVHSEMAVDSRHLAILHIRLCGCACRP